MGTIDVSFKGYDPEEFDLSDFICHAKHKEIVQQVNNLPNYFAELFNKSTSGGLIPSMRVWKKREDIQAFSPRMICLHDSQIPSFDKSKKVKVMQFKSQNAAIKD